MSTLAQPSATDLGLISSAATKYGVPLNLSLAVAAEESGISQTSSSGGILTSPTGALGVYQLEPATAAGLGVDPTSEAQNIIGGNEYLGTLLAQYGGDQAKALAAYNAGPTALAQNTPGAQQSEATYVPAVLALAKQYATATFAGTHPTATAEGVVSDGSVQGAVQNVVTQVQNSAIGAATSTVVSAFFNELTLADFTTKALQFVVIVALFIGGFMVLTRRGAA